MSATENTSAIDEKKAEETGSSTTSPDFKGFILNYMLSIIFTIGIPIFIIGGLGLYTTKVAQSNILPDNIELAPYTIIDRVVDNAFKVDMNIMRPSFFSENKETLSQKAIFNSQEYLDSFQNSFLCSLKKSADPNSGLFANAPLYFSFVYDNLVAKNYLAINAIFLYLSYLPESFIMFLYGIFGIFVWLGLYFFNVCISIFYHIINIPQLFRDKSESDTTKWEKTESISFLRIMKFILFFFLWIPIGTLSAFIMPAFFTLYGLISPLFATYKLTQPSKSDKSYKSYNVIDFIKNTFVYKKLFFFILATLSLFSNGIKYLGNNAIIGLVVAVVFAYFMGLYNNEIPQPGTDGFSLKIKQKVTSSTVTRSDTELVEICKIPIDDAKIEKIISKGIIRELTKPRQDGGYEGEIVEPLRDPLLEEPLEKEPSLQLEKPLEKELSKTLEEPLGEPLPPLGEQLPPLGEPFQFGNTPIKPQPKLQFGNIAQTSAQTSAQPLAQPLAQTSAQPLAQPLAQLSGGNPPIRKYNKKYNISWT